MTERFGNGTTSRGEHEYKPMEKKEMSLRLEDEWSDNLALSVGAVVEVTEPQNACDPGMSGNGDESAGKRYHGRGTKTNYERTMPS